MFNFLKKKKEERAVYSASFQNIMSEGSKGTPLGVTTSYACIRLLAQSVASSPLKHFTITEDGEEEQIKSELSKLIKSPFPNTTYYQWMSSMVTNLISQGNAYSLILRDNGKPTELMFLASSSVSVYKTLDAELPFYYKISENGKSYDVYPEDMLHFRNVTEDNIVGLSPLGLHRITFDAAASISDYNKTFMDNATNVSGIITTDKSLNKETVEEIRKNFGKKFGGANNAGRTPVLSNGLKYEQVKVISPLDADYIANRKMSKSDIAEIYGVPLGMVTNTESKYSNAEQESLNFQQITLAPYFDMIDQEMSLKLIPKYSSRNTYLRFAPDRFRLTTSKERSETISLLTNTGIMTPNEAREHYGLRKIDGGNELKSEGTLLGKEKQAPKNTNDTNPTPGTLQDLNAKRSIEDMEKEIQRLRSHIGRIKASKQ